MVATDRTAGCELAEGLCINWGEKAEEEETPMKSTQ